LVDEQPVGEVVVQQIVLGVDAALGGAGQYGTGDEGIQAVIEQEKS
jgi:hypothetical protein